jgi:hypothetical protein
MLQERRMMEDHEGKAPEELVLGKLLDDMKEDIRD